MDRVRSDCCLFTVGGALLHHRRSVLGHHLVYRPRRIRWRLHRHQFCDLTIAGTGRDALVMAAINLFILNIVGLGLGPVGVGFISDLAAPEFGTESIRYGLLATLVV